ncbi:MAG TPA: penicillin-binding transpeptidase domain-containing protein [Chitinophagaceae bacterium]|nr:penicillin-binding transpeptidase domain-containing protein [Chitinophagaceae bacterium]
MFCALSTFGQTDFQTLFHRCNVSGSTTIFDLRNKRWIFTDSLDALRETQPASTFKVINLLIALETGVIKDENDTVKWVGHTDTVLYGYRPEIYKDMTVKQAFEVSAGWVFIELAKKIGRERYKHFLGLSGYGNGDLSHREDDFWNFGAFGVSPKNQVQFLVDVFEGKAPFSKRNIETLKRVMITETTTAAVIRSKTGWTRVEGKDIGWWVGYVERKGGAFFFATRITKERAAINPRFGQCRKDITKTILRQLHIL